MKTTVTIFISFLLAGCATEMLGQCAMKSVSSDPSYGLGCGLAMTGSAIEGSVMLLNAVKTKVGASANVDSIEAQSPEEEIDVSPKQ